MRVTGVGHAGIHIETAAGSILCDPWVNPAFFGSWFPFPDNSWLDWEQLGKADYLYVSHLHRDHFDAENLARNVRKDATVLLPEYVTDELENELAALGFSRFLRTRSGVPEELDGLRVMITALTGPGDGPIGDSALSVDDGETVLLNQNDAHPLDIPALAEFGKVDAYFLQYSGAIWWPMVYELPHAAKREFAARKRAGQFDRALRYIDEVDAAAVFPNAGPPCFLDEELFGFNGTGTDGESIFTDQREFLSSLAEARPEVSAHLLLPGTVTDVRGREVAVAQPHPQQEIDRIFGAKWKYLTDLAARRAPELAVERAQRSTPLGKENLLVALKDWWEPLLARAEKICAGVGGPVRLNVDEHALVIDFVAREVREWAGERCRYTFTTAGDLVASNIARGEVDWSNSLLLSMRFSASRVGAYNEFVYVFFKCLSVERIDYVENFYDEQGDDGEDIALDGWRIQRRCPHLRADLSKFGSISNDVLTCSLHGWRYDLTTGACLTSAGHEIRASRR
jgi:UDP-MurNAc hydroxylase